MNELLDYLEAIKNNATVGDILGKSEIAPYQSQILSPVLPYVVDTVISDYQSVPDSMRHYFKINIYTDAYSRQNAIGLGEDPSYSVKIPTTRLQGQPLALSFKPTSQADEDAIVNSLPKPHADGSPITADEFPKALPSSIRLTPEVSLAGQILKSEGSYPFGSNLAVDMGYISPNKTDPLASKIIHVGEYHAIGYDMQGLSQQQLEATKAQLEQTKTKLESQQQAQLQGLTKHDITGAILQAGVQSYFALNDAQDRIAQSSANIVQNRMMSFGTFCTYIQPKQVYGLTTAGRLSGMLMDIDRMQRQVTDKDNTLDGLKGFVASQGVRQSANEHLIPEALFDDPATTEKEAEAVSAVKALQIAAQQGQKIFTITQANIDQVLPQLAHKALIIQDVKDAIAAGKIVTISQSTISYKGWTGAGYSIVDPNTGAGAYLIGGGADGAIFFIFGAWLTTVVLLGIIEVGFISFTTLGAGAIVAVPLLILEITAIVLMIKSMAKTYSNGDESKEKFLNECFNAGFVFGASGFIIDLSPSKLIQLIALIGLGYFYTSNMYSCFGLRK